MLKKNFIRAVLIFCLIVFVNFAVFYGIFSLYTAVHP
ncbi:hypothetical protein Tthe_2292 [Thermoanaerobacterium thermosaccharolyticum DSM 571]|uniref:Uncharacterized protein n=1 Tax=Thermoanaerobacterium thermosaccharolyticum (strain ATCC 7956 / DSM 571 / NCIMB 9385 / NCA 3814 / NCTC 13789 / WDCM 00135 / 2032) TaxID=580327 RepID=D9TQY8_THETC|nr:hypothetical protein Tthe_2292 [Thermoanaerobacterium thermosaccharolyticum DSM 571]